MNFVEFQNVSRELFKYLEDSFGFLVTEPPENSIPERLKGYELRYQNRTTAVVIRLELVEQLPTVHLQRLDGSREAYSLGLLLMARAPHLNPLASEHQLPLKQTAAQLLQKYAEALKIAGNDLLRGDFHIFAELKELKAMYLRKGRKRGSFFLF